MKIDSHQHFWRYEPVRDSWITDEMKSIQRDFMPHDLQPVLERNGFHGCVSVQADQSENETKFLLELAEGEDFIRAVVGWVDLRNKNVEERLEYFSGFKKLKGIRHIVQAEPDESFLFRDDFCNGISLLRKYNLTYDILVKPQQLRAVYQFVKRFPSHPFVIDHLAKPYIKDGLIDEWKRDIQAIAGFGNVYCKISGMITEAHWKNWKPLDLKKYIDVAIESFGINRVMFGSDWPVCLVAGTFEQVCEAVETNTSHLTEAERKLLWGLNARDFYHL